LDRRPLGSTGLTVTALGLGAGQIGEAWVSDAEAFAVLDAASACGVGLIDTARGYGSSEERIGRWLASRGSSAGAVVVTKVGYDVPGCADWTAGAVTGGIERAVGVLGVDALDVALLHSCSLEVLCRGEVIEALVAARDAGRVRAVGYSGENEALAWAVASGAFAVVETSVSLADQWSLQNVVPAAAGAGIGVIAKRPLANAPWRFAERPAGSYSETYWERFLAMGLEPGDGDWAGTAARFAAYAPGVSAAIVGTASPAHVRAAVTAVERGPLPEAEVARWREAWARHSWPGDLLRQRRGDARRLVLDLAVRERSVR
jgi:aryl-alcohol dehydrogenase-like predicted oxidoreductase